MKAKQVFNKTIEIIKELGKDKKVTLEYLKSNSKNGHESVKVEVEEIEFKNNNLYINKTEIKDGDVICFDYAISMCRKVLNIDLWVKDLSLCTRSEQCRQQELKEELSRYVNTLEILSIENLKATREHNTFILNARKRMLNRQEESKNYYEDVLTRHDLNESERKTVQKYLDDITKKINKLKLDVYEAAERLDLVDKAMNEVRNSETPINNHKQLLENILKPCVYEFFKNKSYKGNKENLIECLLYALDISSAYTSSQKLTEDEYFKILIEQMNNGL